MGNVNPADLKDLAMLLIDNKLDANMITDDQLLDLEFFCMELVAEKVAGHVDLAHWEASVIVH